ncbi:MAG TPA: hypothetical protein VGF24_26125 [Vicinamibacterales bacterium]
MAGYSGTPLAKKLGLKDDYIVLLSGAPDGYRTVLDAPRSVRFVTKVSSAVNLAQVFSTRRAQLAHALAGYRQSLAPDAVVWVSWPKKASNVPTDITEDTVREIALPLGFVDVKVCAVDDVWSGLKLVVRKELR